VDALDGIDVDELFPDLEEAWESTTGEGGPQLEELEAHDESRPEGSPDNDVEATETETALRAATEVAAEAESELDAAAAQVETEDAASSISEGEWDAEAATLAESGEPETVFESIDEPEVEAPEMAEEDSLELNEDPSALEALSEALGESLETWSGPDESQPAWDPDALLEDEVAVPAWDPEAVWEAEVSDEEHPDAELEAEVSDEEHPDTELEAEVSDEEHPDTELEAEVSDEDSGDLGGLLFGARLATFRARMARSARETDFQAHYDLGLAYKEVALFDEAIAELLVAITGPDALARKSLHLMSEVADLAADESLHLTTSESLREHGMNAEALEHLSHVFADREASGGDTDDIRRRMQAIDPLYVPPSAPEDLAVVSASFDSILDELSVADVEAEVETEAPEAVEAVEATDEPEAADDEPEAADDELYAWELRTAELLEDGHRDEAVRELYRLQAAYEAQEDLAGAMRAVNNLLLLDPGDVILHHQQVEYAIMLDDPAAIANTHLELGQCLQRQGASSNARSTFESVLEIDPDNQSAQAAIAELDAEEVGDEDAPLDSATDDPVHYETHYELGVAFKQDGLHDEAVYELEIAARGLEDPTPAYELLGELFNEAGQHETTSKVLGRALEANGRDDSELAGVLYQLGISHQELGDLDQAADYFRRVVTVDSDYRQVAHRLDQCSL
jgi:tetratricopeptide (TPR) repeat protein